MTSRLKTSVNTLKLKRLGIDTQKEHVAYLRADSHVAMSEGFEALTRVRINYKSQSIVASLHIVHSDALLNKGELGLSEMAFNSLSAKAREFVSLTHLEPIQSLSYVRSKIYGNRVNALGMDEMIKDIVKGNYSNIHLSSFITAFAGENMNTDEIIYLTKSMIASGATIKWPDKLIVDKHCIGGLPGNRTTPIIVSIVSSLGLIMPKTSSRAITSPAGTADTMEVMAPVTLSQKKIENVINKEGGCVVWGNTANLSPADDILIRIERALDLDSEGQLIASVLSKKVAAGSTHVIIDMPVGETVKLRSIEAANHLKILMEKVALAIGLKLKVVVTDGSQPVGIGMGPSLEAMDILAVLRNEPDAPSDLRDRSLLLAGELLELAGYAENGKGNEIATKVLQSGKAYKKFLAICKAQGGFTEPHLAKYNRDIVSDKNGTVTAINNRKLSRV
ncbi:MAG TPA: thymidine phosphorylase family protein, partial [Bacteroidia bacterium]|nr:thymidine phosphorylase family protein [Bacteroidia bacterium]